MCIISSIYESRKQKKAAEKAQKQAKIANKNAQKKADAEKAIASAQEVKKAETVDASKAAELSALSRTKQGVAGTHLNSKLGA